MKECSRCKRKRPLTEFHADARHGHKAACKECRNASDRQRVTARRSVETHNTALTSDQQVPEGYHIRGISTLRDADGSIRAQWIKSAVDRDQQIKALLDAVQTIAEPFRGAAEPSKAPKTRDEDLLCVYPFGDPHFGMYAWADESGENFDLKIAERQLVTAVDHLVGLAPPAAQALIVSLGDLLHADGKTAATTAGTRVDVDSRWGKVLSVVLRAMRRCIDRALEKHATVRVICATGNHDDLSSLVVAVALSQYYEREPRITIDTSPSKFYWYRFGQCLLGVHHGDTAKASDLPGVMACDQAKAWGETQFRHFYCGHVHHESVKEFPGVTVETFRTLAPKDAWHAAQGYRAGRDLRLDVWHREDGPANRHIVGIGKIKRLMGVE